MKDRDLSPDQGQHDQDPDERAIEQAWDRVMAAGAPGGNEPLPAAGDAADAERVREYVELLGLLPYELAAETPPPRVKNRTMARVAGAASPGAGASEPASVVPFRRPSRASRPLWRIAQAAVLAASLAGLGILSAIVRQQSQQIARLSDQVEATTLDRDEVQRVRVEAETYRSRLNMVTTVARHAYPLHTVSAIDSAQQPQGIVYVCGMHQQWYLSLRGLEPPPEDGEYHLWFMTDEGKVDGGVLDVRPGAATEMEALSMPEGTHGFRVTLERRDEPESLTILLGEDVVNL